MKSNKYKPLLLNDLIGLFIQQKYNCDENKHFCINYFIDKEFVNDLDINYFNEIFEEVHLTKQEDGSFSLELFNLKNLEQFEFCYQNNLLDTAYTHIIHFVNCQKILFKKNNAFVLAQEKMLAFESGEIKVPDLYISQLVIKYSLAKNKYDTSAISILTPFIKWTRNIEKHIISYFGS